VALVNVIQHNKVVATLDVFDGEVTADRTAAQMRQCTISLADPDGTLTPEDATSLLTPFGTQLQLLRGVKLPGVLLVANEALAVWSQGTMSGAIVDPVTNNLILGYGH
jgi:hypothetical protein